MQKFSTCVPAGKARKKRERSKKNVRLQLDCQLFAKTICPDLQETECSIKDG
jgi:hypothetical protein